MNMIVNILILVVPWSSGLFSPQDDQAKRPADKIIADIEAIATQRSRIRTTPTTNPQQRAELVLEQLELVDRRDTLIWEFYESYPDHDQVPKLLHQRWIGWVNRPETADQAFSEMAQVLAKHKESSLGTEVLAIRAEAVVRRNARRPIDEFVKNSMPAIDEFTNRAPDDLRGATLLLTVIQRAGSSLPVAKEAELIDRVLRRFPDGTHAAWIKDRMSSKELVSKPLLFEFRDILSGTDLSLEKFKGRVIVLHFWATWCGPCVKELPALKALYQVYHPKGVEFVGVNLDSDDGGGHERLIDFLKANNLSWPQCYDGDRIEDSVARRCHIQAIPAAFVIDREGIVVSTDARDNLGELLENLTEGRLGEIPPREDPSPQPTSRTNSDLDN